MGGEKKQREISSDERQEKNDEEKQMSDNEKRQMEMSDVEKKQQMISTEEKQMDTSGTEKRLLMERSKEFLRHLGDGSQDLPDRYTPMKRAKERSDAPKVSCIYLFYYYVCFYILSVVPVSYF